MNTLEQLAIHYVTDKEKSYGHNYIPGYFDLFDKNRHDIKTMLEIGIGLGGHSDMMSSLFPRFTIGSSLKMWRDYFPNATIYGMDIMECPYIGPRIKTFVGDQSKEEDLMAIVNESGPLDIVVDDGSHDIAHQVYSFMILSNHMKQGGIYVIEDVHGPYIERLKSLSFFSLEFRYYINQNFEYKWYDTRDTGAENDFLMVFIKK
jgi:hypothetical protein